MRQLNPFYSSVTFTSSVSRFKAVSIRLAIASVLLAALAAKYYINYSS